MLTTSNLILIEPETHTRFTLWYVLLPLFSQQPIKLGEYMCVRLTKQTCVIQILHILKKDVSSGMADGQLLGDEL